MADVESVDGITVAQIADASLVTMSDIAARIRRTREDVRFLVTGARGPGRSPTPVTDPRRQGRLWRWSDVERWLATYLGDVPASSADDVKTTINARLELRR